MSNENCRPERRQLGCCLQVQVVVLPSGKRRESVKTYCRIIERLLLDPDSAHRAGIGGIHGLRHLLRRDRPGLGHCQNALHVEHGGAQPGTLGAADAKVGINVCVHRKNLLVILPCRQYGPSGCELCLCNGPQLW